MTVKAGYKQSRRIIFFCLAACVALAYLYAAKEIISDSAFTMRQVISHMADHDEPAPLHVQDRSACMPFFLSHCLTVTHSDLFTVKPHSRVLHRKDRSVHFDPFRLLLGASGILPGRASYLSDSTCTGSRLQTIFYIHRTDGSK